MTNFLAKWQDMRLPPFPTSLHGFLPLVRTLGPACALSPILLLGCSDSETPGIFACGYGTKVTPGGCELDESHGLGGAHGDDAAPDDGKGDGDADRSGDGDDDAGRNGDGDGDSSQTGGKNAGTGGGDSGTGGSGGYSGGSEAGGAATGGMTTGGTTGGSDTGGSGGNSATGGAGTGGLGMGGAEPGEPVPQLIAYQKSGEYAILDVSVFPPEEPLLVGDSGYGWSPDGSYLVTCQDGLCGTRFMNGETPGPFVPLTVRVSCSKIIEWSPDSKRVALTQCRDVSLATPDPHLPPTIELLETYSKGYGFSSTSKYYAYGADLNVISATSANSDPILRREAPTSDVSWSPQGDWITWSEDTSHYIADVAAPTIEPQLLATGTGSGQAALWSPDGTRFSIAVEGVLHIFRLEDGSWTPWQGAIGTPLAWSPNSLILVTDETALVDTSTQPYETTSYKVAADEVTWRFDSSAFVSQGIRSNAYIGIVGTPELTSSYQIQSGAEFSPTRPYLFGGYPGFDLPWLFYLEDDGTLSDVAPRTGQTFEDFVWSPDGSALVYCAEEGLYVVHLKDDGFTSPIRLDENCSGATWFRPQ